MIRNFISHHRELLEDLALFMVLPALGLVTIFSLWNEGNL